LFRNCLLRQIISGNMEGMGRPGKCKRLLGDLKENRRYWSYKKTGIRLHSEELTLEAAMDLSQDRFHNEHINKSLSGCS
jgi:hypothetical protein